jgi:cytochrome c
VFAKSIFVLCLSLFTTDLSYNLLQTDGGSAPSGGIYTTAQAQRGKTDYAGKCASCHGAGLEGMEPFPALNTPEFLAKYDGQPIATLFEKIQKTMPGDHPGSLTPTEAAEITAFILSTNKYPAGATELPSDEDSLKKLQLPKPTAP